MHPLGTVQIQNSEDGWRIRLRRYSHKRQASDCPKIHRNNTGLLSVAVIKTLDHKHSGTVLDDIIDNSATGHEVRLQEGSALAVHARRITETLSVTNQNESSLGAADFERRVQNFLKGCFRREECFPLILKIEDAGNLLQV